MSSTSVVGSPQSPTDCDNMKAEVLRIDDKCLQLNLFSTEEDDGPYTIISNKMHFDCVSHSSISTIKSELAIVIDDVLLKNINSSIIRFSNKIEMDITIFFDLFLTLLNKRIYHQKYKLQYIKLECLDIAATAGNTETQSTEHGLALRGNLADPEIFSDEGSNNDATFRLNRNSKNNFRSTRDLLLWLLNEYRYKFAEHRGHEKLLFTFSILDDQQNIFKVKLALFNIYLDLMNTEDRNHWVHFMDHMGNGCQGLNCNFIHSGLTISLSSHTDGVASQNTLFIFNVPTDIKFTTDTIEMLQMAYAVIQNRKKKQIKVANPVKKKIRSLKGEDITNHNKERRSSLPLSKVQGAQDLCHHMSYNNNQLYADIALLDNSYSKMDFNTLSGWYRKIDERFNKVWQLRKYFKRYFELKFDEVSANIKHIYKSLESLYPQNTERDLVELQENQVELHKLFERYHNARTLFRQLSESIQNTEFEELLMIYLNTKMFDLNKHALTLKNNTTNSVDIN